MKTTKIALLSCIASCVFAAGLAWTAPKAAAATPVLTSLFDGKTLAGWTQRPPGSFSVNATDAAIATTGKARGFIYTNTPYTSYRVIYSVRQLTWLHWPTVLFFGNSTTADAMGAVQFQLPQDYSWDYRKGKNKSPPRSLLHTFGKPPGIQKTGVWYRCEILVNQTNGTADSAAAVLGSTAVHVMKFTDPAIPATPPCSFAIQCHQTHIQDEFKDILIEVNPPYNGLVLLNLPAPANLTATAVSATHVDLAWTIASSNQTGFQVFSSPDNTNWASLTTLPATTTSYSNTGLSPNTTYYYRVAATMPDAISDYATANVTLAPLPASASSPPMLRK